MNLMAYGNFLSRADSYQNPVMGASELYDIRARTREAKTFVNSGIGLVKMPIGVREQSWLF
jgi:hypothetical protein